MDVCTALINHCVFTFNQIYDPAKFRMIRLVIIKKSKVSFIRKCGLCKY